MENKSSFADDKYAWGATCAEGFTVGLHVEGREFRPDTTIRWNWAIVNQREDAREVTIKHDQDRAFRYRLRITRPDSDQSLWDFTPPVDKQTVTTQRRQIMAVGKTVVPLEGGEASIDQSWGPGAYHLQLIFGGAPFNFECRSGVVKVLVK